MALTLEDILSGKPRMRSKVVDYGNGLQFEIKSLSAAAFRQMAKEMSEHEDDEDDDYTVGVAIKFIKGENHHPTSDEIKAFREMLDLGVIQRLVIDGLNFNRGAEDIAAAAKKS